MRIVLLLPLAAMVATYGCGSERTKHSEPSVQKRDLTLQTDRSPQVEFVSPVELQRTPAQPQANHSFRRTRRQATAYEPTIVPAVLKSTTAAPATVFQPAAAPVPVVSEPANPNELLPGKTITIIPASSGPSTAPDPTDEGPETRTNMGGTIGGGCRGGGGGSGMGGPPPMILR